MRRIEGLITVFLFFNCIDMHGGIVISKNTKLRLRDTHLMRDGGSIQFEFDTHPDGRIFVMLVNRLAKHLEKEGQIILLASNSNMKDGVELGHGTSSEAALVNALNRRAASLPSDKPEAKKLRALVQMIQNRKAPWIDDPSFWLD